MYTTGNHIRLLSKKTSENVKIQLTLPFHFLQNCASSRPSSSVTSSRPVSFPLGTTPSQEEEATPTYSSSTNPGVGKEEERTRGELSDQYHSTIRLCFWPSVFSHWQSWLLSTVIKNIIVDITVNIQYTLKQWLPHNSIKKDPLADSYSPWYSQTRILSSHFSG